MGFGNDEQGEDNGELVEKKDLMDPEEDETEGKVMDSKKQRFTYSREELLNIGKLVEGGEKPEYLTEAYDCFVVCNHKTQESGSQITAEELRNPDRWPVNSRAGALLDDRNRSSSFASSSKRERIYFNGRDGLQRRKDPKDRVKEESQDNIVLSPQRRSFNTGCHMPHNNKLDLKPAKNDTNNHLSKASEVEHVPPKPRNGPRVGTGRIPSNRERNHDWERGKASLERDRNFEKSFNRNMFDREDYGSRRFGGRFEFENRSRGNYHRDEEPEWMSEGPTSQSETIELRGFDEEEREKEVKREIDEEKVTAKDSNNSGNDILNYLENTSNKPKSDRMKDESNEFDINEMFKLEHWRGSSNDNIVQGSTENSMETQGSRSARWFTNSNREDSPIDRLFANVSFINEDQKNSFDQELIANKISNGNRSQIDEKRNDKSSGGNKDIMNLFQKANINLSQLMQQRNISNPTINMNQAKSLSELEASLKQSTIDEVGKEAQTFEQMKRFNPPNYAKKMIDGQQNGEQLERLMSNDSTPPSASTSQSAFSSLTPTSVIRKIAFEKDKEILQKVVSPAEDFAKKQSSQNQYPVANGLGSDHLSSTPPILRPIVKGNLHPPKTQHQQPPAMIDSDKLSKLVEQHRMQQQQQQQAIQSFAAQRPIQAINANTGLRFGMAATPFPVSTTIRPDQMAPTTVIRNMVQSGAINPAVHSTVMNPIHIQQYIQQQQHPQHQHIPRGGVPIDTKQIQALAQARGVPPAAIQQLLMKAAANIHTHAAAAAAAAAAQAQAQAVAFNQNPCSQRINPKSISPTGFLSGKRVQQSDGNQQQKNPQVSVEMMQFTKDSGQGENPENLKKWFGKDVFNQSLPLLPVQKAMLLEDLERQ